MDYELEVAKNKKRNKKYIKEFEIWLKDKNLSQKTIRRHVSYIDLYLNHYLNYYDIIKMENGIYHASSFLGSWFIRKCLYTSKYLLKESSTSIKKFYQCMSEKSYVKQSDYEELCSTIKKEMNYYLKRLEDYQNGTFYDIYK